LPDQMFYNTEIGTYIWILSNRKDKKSKGKVKLIDARDFGTRMRKSLGDKRNEITPDSIQEITRLYSDAFSLETDERIRIMQNFEFGYARLTLERPLRCIWSVSEESLLTLTPQVRASLNVIKDEVYLTRELAESAITKVGLAGKEAKAVLKAITTTDPNADPVIGKKGAIEADPDLREIENIPLMESYLVASADEQRKALRAAAETILKEEILPYYPDAWIDFEKTKIGYEIPFTRKFYKYIAPREVKDIRNEIIQIESEIQTLMKELF
jgi:type I restriction enzyme M protein